LKIKIEAMGQIKNIFKTYWVLSLINVILFSYSGYLWKTNYIGIAYLTCLILLGFLTVPMLKSIIKVGKTLGITKKMAWFPLLFNIFGLYKTIAIFVAWRRFWSS